MPKCYDNQCSEYVPEEYTYCDGCKEKHYPSKANPFNIAEKVKQLAARAPKRAESIEPPSAPKIATVSNKRCFLCPPKKKAVVAIQLQEDVFICWSHKVTMEAAHGFKWQSIALSQFKRTIQPKEGTQPQFAR